MVSRWFRPGNRTFLEVASMVVTWWVVAFCAAFITEIFIIGDLQCECNDIALPVYSF